MAATIAKKAKKEGTPTYRLRTGYDQAIVTLTDAQTRKRKDYWLGEYDSPESHEMFRRVLAKWEQNGRRLFDPDEVPKSKVHKLTITEVIYAYKSMVEKAYKRPSQQTIYMALRILRQFYGATAAEEFGPSRLRLLREQMIKGDLTAEKPRKPWSRTTVNKAVHQICAMFKWAAGEEMLPAEVFSRLKTVGALRRGRGDAAEPEPVGPVAIEIVEATKKHLNRQVKALVELQLLTGARGCELLRLRPIDLQMDNKKGIWQVQLHDHKTLHHGHDRIIYFGPKAQTVIKPFLVGRPLDAFLFSPAEADAEQRAERAAKRKTPPRFGNRVGSNRMANPKRKPGSHYTSSSYRRAIERACLKAGVRYWHPHQLRHTAATLFRRKYGLETARVLLGHSSALVTDAVYAERDVEKMIFVMQQLG